MKGEKERDKTAIVDARQTSKPSPYEQLHLITGSHDVYRCHLKKSVARSDYPTNKRQQEGTKV